MPIKTCLPLARDFTCFATFDAFRGNAQCSAFRTTGNPRAHEISSRNATLESFFRREQVRSELRTQVSDFAQPTRQAIETIGTFDDCESVRLFGQRRRLVKTPGMITGSPPKNSRIKAHKICKLQYFPLAIAQFLVQFAVPVRFGFYLKRAGATTMEVRFESCRRDQNVH